MSLEQALAANTAALEANTAALLKSGGGAASTGKGTTTTKDKPPKEEKKGATRAEMEAALTAVKEKHKLAAAKEIIANVGEAAKMGEIAEDKIQAVYDAAKAKEAEDVAEDGM